MLELPILHRHYYGRETGAAPLLLDTLASSPIGAYALFKLKNSYAGSCIRVSKPGPGFEEADIGFDANGELDTAALIAHCGSGDGFIATVYDQSGNARDHTQTTASQRPQIVSSGALVGTDDDGRPYFTLNGSTQFLSCDALAPLLSGSDVANSIFAKLYGTSVASSYDPICFTSVASPLTRHFLRLVGSTGRFSISRSDDTTATVSAVSDGTPFQVNTWLRFSQIFTGTNVSFWVNETLEENNGALNVGTATYDTFRWGCRDSAGTPSSHFPGRANSLIVMASAASDADRILIEAEL